jgi:hypothetical protein
MGMKLYVGNLAFSTPSKDLQELFAAAGTVESASVVEDRDTGRSRGLGKGRVWTTQGEVILLGEVTKVENAPMVDDQEASKQAELYFAEIAESRKRSRRTQTEIERLKKKTQAIIDALT